MLKSGLTRQRALRLYRHTWWSVTVKETTANRGTMRTHRTVSTEEIPLTEADILVAATGLTAECIERHRGQLSELERNVLSLRAPIFGESIADREIGRRLGCRPREIRRIAAEAAAKLGHVDVSTTRSGATCRESSDEADAA